MKTGDGLFGRSRHPRSEAPVNILELAARVGARPVAGTSVDLDSNLSGAAALDRAGEGELSFYADGRYKSALASTGASAVIVDETAFQAESGEVPHARLVHGNPAAAFARALEIFHPEAAASPGVHPTAVVEEGAILEDGVSVAALAFVGSGAVIGSLTRLMPGAYVGPMARIGADCLLGPRSVVASGCVLGDRVRLQPGAVVGSDGFGYVLDTDEAGSPFHRKIPQVGIVRIEDDVEIGAGACIDRATTGETLVGRGTKIDNLVQVGHNCVIGPLSILCGQSGLAGSTRLGRGVVLGGQAAVAGHLTVGDGVRAGGRAGIVADVDPGLTVSGVPAIPHRLWLRVSLALRELPDLVKRVRRLERRLDSE